MNEFSVGQVVYLNSGGKPLTVVSLRDDGRLQVASVNAMTGALEYYMLPVECFSSYKPIFEMSGVQQRPS